MQEIQRYITAKISSLIGVTDIAWSSFLTSMILFAILGLAVVCIYYIIKLVVLRFIRGWFKNSKLLFLHIVAKNKTLNAVAHLVSANMLLILAKLFLQQDIIGFTIQQSIVYLAEFYLYLSVMLLIYRLLWSLNTYYVRKFDFASQYPIYNYIKVIVLFSWIIWFILVIAYFANTSPFALLTGIGAISAVLLLVFKDTLLGIVASIQVTVSNIVRIGDRISIDRYNVDGEIIDIAINTVKVQNGDNTIATIPTYALVSEVVKNWRGMTESGARRIKRSIYLDITSIAVCSPELLSELNKIEVIKAYIAKHQGEEIINLALYREYIIDYLLRNPQISKDFATVVRHLDPGINGLPLEIYTFSTETAMAGYEKVQADIFEHCFSVLPRFALRVLQSNTA